MSEESGHGGGGAFKRSASRFDPVAGVRMVADIQAEGLRAAGELLDRILRSEPDGRRSPEAAGGYTALVDAWSDLFWRTVTGLIQPPPNGATAVSVDGNGVGQVVRLALPANSAGGTATEFWLHNGAASDVGPLTLSCGELSDSGGTPLDSAEVRFDPGVISLLPARSGRAVVVSLAVKGPLRPGLYRGTIQAQGAPALWLPLEVEIDPC